MKAVNRILDKIRGIVRAVMRKIAISLDAVSGGRITPNAITLTSLLAHIIIAWCIALQEFHIAALLLVLFGLFDTLDGELARLQKRASPAGMLLDASTDRMKEVLLYMGVAYAFIAMGNPYASVWAVLACGASLSVSYVKAKGETAVRDKNLSASEINRIFSDGLLRYEIRMTLLLVGLLFPSLLVPIVAIIGIGSAITAIGRLITISRQL